MSLHGMWAAAKKRAWKEFKETQKNYLKEQDKKINAMNDAKAKKKALDLVLAEVGLDKGESLDDYLKFADGFGKSLDAFEQSVENNAKLDAKLREVAIWHDSLNVPHLTHRELPNLPTCSMKKQS